jgi:murein DD-endopeptidase / murein LD-carboxypeptidase
MNQLCAARQAVAQRALDQVGTEFRLFGRTAGKAIDCVGLALVALGPELPLSGKDLQYSLKGEQLALARRYLSNGRLQEIFPPDEPETGDLALVRPGPSQLHFMVRAAAGWVHADAAIGCVVLRPGELDWPIAGLWRLDGI